MYSQVIGGWEFQASKVRLARNTTNSVIHYYQSYHITKENMIKTKSTDRKGSSNAPSSQTSHSKLSSHLQQVIISKPIYRIKYNPIRREPAAATGTFNEPAPLAGTMVSEGVAVEEELAAVEVPLCRIVLVIHTNILFCEVSGLTKSGRGRSRRRIGRSASARGGGVFADVGGCGR